MENEKYRQTGIADDNSGGTQRVIQRTNMTETTRARFDNSPSKHYKKILLKCNVSIPTCFIALPYELQLDPETQQLYVSSENIDLAKTVGMYLLTMNKITAKLSFWMSMDNYMSRNKHGRKKIMEWLNRSRKEKNTKLTACEIVSEIHVGSQYVALCKELLEKDDNHTNAKAYVADPMKAAIEEYKTCTEDILKCYEDSLSERLFFYLVDEYSLLPVKSSSYPIPVRAKKLNLLENLFLQFMSTSIMAASALDELTSVAKLLGLPPSVGIPSSWMNLKAGLVHSSTNPSSVAEFAKLQREIRRQGKSAGVASDKSERHSQQQEGAHEVFLLLKFYMTYDPSKRFSNLRRVSDSEGSTIWISRAVRKKIEAEAEEKCEKSRLMRNDSEEKTEENTMEDMEEEVKTLMIALNRAQKVDNMNFSHSYHPSSSSGPRIPSSKSRDPGLSCSTHGALGRTNFLKQSSSSQKGKKNTYRGKKFVSYFCRRN